MIQDNVAYDWIEPFWDSFGISWAAYSQGTQIRNNFFDVAAVAPGGDHTGMCLEIDGADTLVEGNTCVASNNPQGRANNASDAVVAGTNAVIRSNTFCGGPQTIGTETSWATFQAYANTFPACGPVVPHP